MFKLGFGRSGDAESGLALFGAIVAKAKRLTSACKAPADTIDNIAISSAGTAPLYTAPLSPLRKKMIWDESAAPGRGSRALGPRD